MTWVRIRNEAAMEELEQLYSDFGADDNDVLVVLEAADACWCR